MCGISGAIGWVDEEVLDAVRRADRALRHRGPDGEGLWTDAAPGVPGCVALAHRRLAILDLSELAAQPMRDPETGVVLVYNGEVSNFPALRAELIALGHRFHSTGDTEVVLRGWLQWREGLPMRLAGMFAFVLWDPRVRRAFFVRDRVGIKPLYLAEVRRPQGRTVLFASELRSLLATGLVPRVIDRVGLASYLWHGFVFGPNTIVDGIQLLPAGSCMSVTPGAPAPAPKRYWRHPRYAGGPHTTADELEQALRESVQGLLLSDVPVGVFLSGGVDSSALVAMAVQARDPASVHTFNIYYDEAKYDESRYAEAVARALGTHHTPILLRGEQVHAQLDDAFGGMDQPTFDGLNSYFVSRAVREAGVKVALSGTGGDELFGGYRSFVDVPRVARVARQTRWLPPPVMRRVIDSAVRVRTGRPGVLPPQTRWGKLSEALATRGDLTRLFLVTYAIYTQELLPQLMPGYASAGTLYGVPAGRFPNFAASVDGRGELDAVSTLELQCYITERLMRDTDAASMAVSLEVRVPLLEHTFIEAAAGLDPRLRFQPLRKKMVLRQAALRNLDPSLFDRPKTGFEMPFAVWCQGALREDIRGVMHDDALARAIGLDPAVVTKVWQAVTDDAPGFYWSRLWTLYSLLRWCRDHGLTA